MEIDRVKILIEEIKIIQDIIKRMAANSFQVKTWAISLVVVTLILRGNSNHVLIAYIPLISFWILDAYYLKQERIFREIYKWIISYRMINDDKLFEIKPNDFKKQVASLPKTMCSISIFPFYGSIFLLLTLYIIFEGSTVVWLKEFFSAFITKM
jgi:hypothetical protein